MTLARPVGEGPRYTPTTCFEIFPLPWPPGKEDAKSEVYARISDAARELNEQRERWLNPPEWIADIAAGIDRYDKFDDVPAGARELVRQSAIMAAAAKDARFKKRTLTNLYNERPTWLRIAHEKLDLPSSPPTRWSIRKAAGQKIGPRSGLKPAPASRYLSRPMAANIRWPSAAAKSIKPCWRICCG